MDTPEPPRAPTPVEETDPAGRARSSRRQLIRGAGTLAAAGLLGTGALGAGHRLSQDVSPRTEIPLWSGTVAYTGAARRALVGGRAGDVPLRAGTRLATALPPDSPICRRAAMFQEGTAAWRERVVAAMADTPPEVREAPPGSPAGSAPARGTLPTATAEDLARSALADLWVLADDLPAPVAGWSPSWRYVWPRDGAFAAVALAAVGHVDRAAGILEHFATVQAEDGWFEARYVPGTAQPPDRRPAQFDATGLLLWAVAEVVDATDRAGGPGSAEVTARLSGLISRSLGTLHRVTRGGTGFPPVSPDYWERREHAVTVWTMAATLAGLRAGARLTGSARARRAAETFAALYRATFGAHGHQRYRRGGGADSGSALFAATGHTDLVPVGTLAALRDELARPGGGIAPGAGWPDDGVSWTPSTSLLGLALARSGEREAAAEILAWLAAHRTAEGSLPEKVLHDGRPAEVAPLAWTAANTLLTLEALAED